MLGANTYRAFAHMLASADPDSDVRDQWVTKMRHLPTTVVSNTLREPLDWPDATLAHVSAADVVAQLKEHSDVPLRSHGSLSLNHSLMAADLVDEVQVTVFPVISSTSGTEPIMAGAADFDLELLRSRTLNGGIQELTYVPTLRK